jgi:hypothetical protein
MDSLGNINQEESQFFVNVVGMIDCALQRKTPAEDW